MLDVIPSASGCSCAQLSSEFRAVPNPPHSNTPYPIKMQLGIRKCIATCLYAFFGPSVTENSRHSIRLGAVRHPFAAAAVRAAADTADQPPQRATTSSGVP